MHGLEKSYRPIRPAKPANKAGQPAAELVEERGLVKGNQTQDPGASRALCRAWCGQGGEVRPAELGGSIGAAVFQLACRLYPRQEPDAVCVGQSWYQLAGESPAWSKSSRQASSEFCGRRGNAGSEA